jgi:UDP-glucose 4-epimerase
VTNPPRNASSQRSCIVLGGGGFIGTNLCRRLATSEMRVRAFGRRAHFPNQLGNVEWYEGDFTDPAALADAIATFDVVIHLVHATTPQSSNLNMASDVERTLQASITMLDICRKLGVKRVVFISSGGTVYGRAQQIPTPETAPTEPITAYGISKLAIEKYLALFEDLHRLDHRVLRVTNAYGPFHNATKNQGIIGTLISRALRNQKIVIWGDGSVVRDFVYVDDVVDALEAAIGDRSDQRIFNIGSGQGRSVRDIVEAIKRKLAIKLDIEWQQPRPLDVQASIVNIDRARDVLGWRPRTNLEAGLEKTIDWWKYRDAGGTPRVSAKSG